MEKDRESGERKTIKFSKKMCNYFSFGVDAMVGYGILTKGTLKPKHS